MRPLAALVLLTVGLIGCASEDEGFEQQQLANPASVFCVEEMEGRVEFVKTDQGTSGVCHLPDGTSIDEWELYRQHNG